VADEQRPVVVAFDGSAESAVAVRAAAELFPTRSLLVVTVWETGLALTTPVPADFAGTMPPPLPDPRQVELLDNIEHQHAQATAEAGVAIARESGCPGAVPVPVPDELDVAEAVEAVASQRDAAAIVVGSRGRGGLRSTLMGSTSKRLLHDARRPVVVVRAPERG
jgi:nucleotide-binding universal stress UspA family protein